MVDNFEQKIKL